MGYRVKEVFYSVQGEGFHAGRPAIFCRLSNCNLWTGREEDRDDAVCKFCDTDFIGTDGQNGGSFASANDLVQHLLNFWPDASVAPFVVLTGGEPLLQVDQTLVDALHAAQFEIAIETNGTKRPPKGIDWICVSPKANAQVILTQGHELKLVYPQLENQPSDFSDLDFSFFYLQPLDTGEPKTQHANLKACLAYCLKHPKWRLSLQTHKILGVD
ncbi:7-carboxy-7-deazaguanine synthase [Thiosulfativibrio zosterae]|uniref:7-carboxy-7-deazaguanine synthase n=1 Tax=Thiosulfativibrio zosterae TaxID=2675053 RepID=A0A6F8PPD4_9GAMM|nr:7-carboxy-7-deazaguanine synthase [Thiosulfativibrio zosterae]BBP43965.1 7-carboxy-7-deazaguanine synthase [Thiosulfativibrio zosterae]